MGKSGFKMKGSPFQRNFGIGVSPVKGRWDDFKKSVKKTAGKVYDKASQVGMGIKAAHKELSRNIDPSEFRVDKRHPIDKFNTAYEKEKKYDDAHNKWKNAPKAPEKTAPTTTQNMKNVQKMKSRATAIDNINKKNPKMKLKY